MQSDLELEFMASIAKHASGLDPLTINRVLRWAADRYKVPAASRLNSSLSDSTDIDQETTANLADVAPFIHKVDPQSNADRALAVAYWVQHQPGQSDFGAQDVNTKLKHLGHGVSNITETLNSLMNQSPRLVIQKQKQGTSKQARKRYMVTAEGEKHVEELISKKEGQSP